VNAADLRAELRPMLRLALPVVVVQVGLMAMGVVDTMMVGRVSPAALAAVALGNLYVFTALMYAMGVLQALDPVFSQAVGAGDTPALARGLRRGMALALLLSVPTAAVLWPAGAVLGLLGQPAEILPGAQGYARASIPGVPPLLVFFVLRQVLQSMHRTGPIVVTIVIANLLNAGLNVILIFGAGPVPPMGAVGSAWATTASRFAMAAGLARVGWAEIAPLVRARFPGAASFAALARSIRLGSPIGFQYLLEIGAFSVIALLMGRFGTVEVAAHQVTINLASLTFMVPLGVSVAAAVRVGHAVGRGDPEGARVASAVALAVGAAFMAACGVAFLSVPGLLVRRYTADAAVVGLAAGLIPIAGVFQVFDGVQVVAAGVLRGLGRIRTPMVVNVLGFWLLGMPVSLGLAFPAGLGPAGLWWGLVAGLGAVALVMLATMRAALRGSLRRLESEPQDVAAGGRRA
jgi:MATE family multidrug resistance protein